MLKKNQLSTEWSPISPIKIARLVGIWLLLVTLNSGWGLLFGSSMQQSTAWFAGIVAGMLSFTLLYAAGDWYVLRTGRPYLSRQLRWAAGWRAVLQCVYVVDIVLGMLAVGLVKTLFGLGTASGWPFLTSYLITLTLGGLYSVLLFLILLMIQIIVQHRTAKTTVPPIDPSAER